MSIIPYAMASYKKVRPKMSKQFKIEIVDSSAYIVSPYNPKFVARVKALGGKWDASSKRWRVSAQSVDTVRAAMLDVYGQNDEPVSETVTVIVRFSESDHAPCAPYVLFGRVIATAWGRDSGARVGEDVAFIQGKPTSGGSAKNWGTYIPEGAVIEIYGIPKDYAQRCINDLDIPFISAEIKGTPQIDRDALIEEKARLSARIAEIEKLLA